MAPYTDTLSLPRDSFSLFEDIEIDDLKQIEQHSRLLGDEESSTTVKPETENNLEWRLRPWVAIISSVFVIIMFVLGLIFFSNNFIMMSRRETKPQQPSIGYNDFRRRPESDYVLDTRWDFNAPPKTREYNWTILNIVANPDGVFRPILTINGQFPGPMIECNEGDTLIINVDNQGINATTLHFHGIFQNGTNWMDGTPGVTQCPIAPKRKFQYKFTITGQSGTYFYHGHTAVQASDGLFGPLVVHSKVEHKLQKIPYTSDRVVMVQDYYHDMSSGLLFENLSPGGEGSPLPDGALINGLNQGDCSETNRICDNSTTSLYSSRLVQNTNHRLRFINVGVLSYFHISIDAHKMAITEADGTDILPFYDTKLIISPAQRYSVIITTNQTETSSFWLRARMMLHCLGVPEDAPESPPLESSTQVLGTIHYITSNITNPHPTSKDWAQDPLQECLDTPSTSLIPSSFQAPPKLAAHTYLLESNMQSGDYRLERGNLNSTSFTPNLKSPSLHQTLSSLQNPNSSFPTLDGVNPITFPNNLVIQHYTPQTIDVIIQNFDELSHPLHLHGHKFWVLGSSSGPFPGYSPLGLKPEGKGTLNGESNVLDNLIRRDVATLEGFGWLAIRFVVDNPGVWAFHCHMAWHSEKGLGIQFLSGVEEMRKWEVPEGNKRLCERELGELDKGGRPNDEVWSERFGEYGDRA